jgi:hypothetical protein
MQIVQNRKRGGILMVTTDSLRREFCKDKQILTH